MRASVSFRHGSQLKTGVWPWAEPMPLLVPPDWLSWESSPGVCHAQHGFRACRSQHGLRPSSSATFLLEGAKWRRRWRHTDGSPWRSEASALGGQLGRLAGVLCFAVTGGKRAMRARKAWRLHQTQALLLFCMCFKGGSGWRPPCSIQPATLGSPAPFSSPGFECSPMPESHAMSVERPSKVIWGVVLFPGCLCCGE